MPRYLQLVIKRQVYDDSPLKGFFITRRRTNPNPQRSRVLRVHFKSESLSSHPCQIWALGVQALPSSPSKSRLPPLTTIPWLVCLLRPTSLFSRSSHDQITWSEDCKATPDHKEKTKSLINRTKNKIRTYDLKRVGFAGKHQMNGLQLVWRSGKRTERSSGLLYKTNEISRTARVASST